MTILQVEEPVRDRRSGVSRGTIPPTTFCRFCGARNKNDQMKCGNCGALLK